MNSEPRCVNCAYWGCSHPEHSLEAFTCGKHRSCGCPEFRLGYHYRDNSLADDSAHVENDEGWGFTTGPLFGCVHFVRRAIE